jgi:hypothetical protein
VSLAVAAHNNEEVAQEAGFKSYADFTAAGNISPNDYYAQQQGWNNYADQLHAQVSGFNSAADWNTHLANEDTATKAGFKNYDDMQKAGDAPANDYYAKQQGWQSFSQQQEAEQSGFKSPTIYNAHLTDVKNETDAVTAGFPNYQTQQRFWR